jgi:hypothetical protein
MVSRVCPHLHYHWINTMCNRRLPRKIKILVLNCNWHLYQPKVHL